MNLTNLALDDSDELNGPGTFTIPSGASAVFGNPSGGDQVVLTGGIDLVNKGTLTLPINDELLAEPSTFENAGTVDMGDSSSIINNGGEASITNDAGATISYTGKTGAPGSVDLTGKNGGRVATHSGTLNIFSLSETPRSTIEIGVSANPGQLNVTGAAALKGSLAIKTDSGYRPAIGAQVTVIKATSLAGTFSAITGVQLTGEHWTVIIYRHFSRPHGGQRLRGHRFRRYHQTCPFGPCTSR